MPSPAAAKPKGKGGLGKKAGPLPIWAWVLLAAAVLGYFLFFHKGSSAAAAQSSQTKASTPDASTGEVPSAGGASDTGQASSDLMSAYGADLQLLLSGQQMLQTSVSDLALGQVQALQTQTTNAPVPYSQDSYKTDTQPGGSNAPTVTYTGPGPSAVTGTGYTAGTSTGPGTVSAKGGPSVPVNVGLEFGIVPTGQQKTGGFGGVTSVKTLANGSTLTTYASGRQVQQSPGKSPYVVKK